jgi:putative glutathione S-transferase
MLNTEFNALATRNTPDYYPAHLSVEIEQWNERIYHTVNNGVYRAGFATSQAEYERAVTELFGTLDVLDAQLAKTRFVCGDNITEADWRLFPTLIRFDPVYYGHFKCNLRRIVDYPNLWRYTRELYHHPYIADTVNMAHIKEHYYGSHRSINPSGIVPKGPLLDL